MARKRKRKLKKKVKIVFIIIILIVLGGAISFMLSNKDSKVLKNTKKKTEEKTKKVIEEKPKLNKAPTNSEEAKKFGDGEYETTKGYTLKIENGITYVDNNILIVNKTYGLPEDYKPLNPYNETNSDWSIEMIDKDAMNAFKSMQSDAAALNLNIYISSGYRGYNSQKRIYENYVLKDGKDAADTYSARPGYSEHQSGLCFDLNSVNDSFTNTNEGKWVNDNAYLYGFTIRFPKGKETETGYQYESWHLRYVGKELAEKLYNKGDWLSLEDYYGLTSKY